MIIQALRDYAHEHGLADIRGYQMLEIRWLIHLSDAGEFVSIEETTASDSDSKKKPRARSFLAPILPKRSSGIAPGLFIDKAEYVLGHRVADPKESEAERLRRDAACIQKRDSFRGRLARVYDATQDEDIGAVLRFLQSYDRNVIAEVRDTAFAGNDIIGFAIEPFGQALHDPARDNLRAFVDVDSQIGTKQICSTCNTLGTIARTHPSIKGVRGANSSGASLVSFNTPAFESFGMEQGAVGATCVDCANAYVAASHHLLGRSGSKERNAFHLSNRVTVLAWTTGVSAADSFSLEDLLTGPSADEVRAAYHSPYRGKLSASISNSSRYRVLVLGGEAGRIAIREWIDQALDDTLRHVSRFLDDLDVGSDFPPSIYWLIKSLKPKGKEEESRLIAPLLRCALTGQAIPLSFLSVAVRRLRVPGEFIDENDRLSLDAVSRIALIKAVLRRQADRQLGDLPPMLDTDRTDPAYLCGRLLCILDRAQEKATNAKAGIVERYYGAASSRPALVFGSLLRGAQNHLTKTEVGYLNRDVQDVLANLPSFPTTLSMQDQGLFALGFYHQRKAFFTKKAVTSTDGEKPTDPQATSNLTAEEA